MGAGQSLDKCPDTVDAAESLEDKHCKLSKDQLIDYLTPAATAAAVEPENFAGGFVNFALRLDVLLLILFLYLYFSM